MEFLEDFISILFELLGYQEDFYLDAFSEGIFSSLGLIDIFISLSLVLTFYFIINRPSFSRWQHWLIMLIINFVIAFAVGFFVPSNTFSALGIEYEISQFIIFALKNAVIASVFFLIWTYCFKWRYGAAKGQPKLFGKF